MTAESATYVTGSGGAIVRLLRRSKRTQTSDVTVSHFVENYPRPVDLDDREGRNSELTAKQGYPLMETWSSEDGTRVPCHTLCVPVEIQGRVQGTVSVFRVGSKESAYTSEERRLLGTLLSYAATCIENGRLFETVRRTERELRDAHQQLFLREKLAALGEMAAGVAHELRNPLVSIGGYARRICKYVNNPDKVQECVSIITREVERLETLASDILKYVSPREPSFAAVDLNVLFRDVFQMQREFANRKPVIHFQRDVSPEATYVWADREHLETALIDLVRNAVEACVSGGSVIVRSEPHENDPTRIYIIVEDTGTGIPEETLQNIFTPFFTTKTTGSGLGLATTKNVIDAHEGQIDVESRVGEGTVFRIALFRPPQQTDQQDNNGGSLQ
ncbi:MAG TPA: ATP-binding protein [bacterium]|nr:ATP-binding protein [bacterium]